MGSVIHCPLTYNIPNRYNSNPDRDIMLNFFSNIALLEKNDIPSPRSTIMKAVFI